MQTFAFIKGQQGVCNTPKVLYIDAILPEATGTTSFPLFDAYYAQSCVHNALI